MPTYRLLDPTGVLIGHFSSPGDAEALSQGRWLAARVPYPLHDPRVVGPGGFHLERQDVRIWNLVRAWVPQPRARTLG